MGQIHDQIQTEFTRIHVTDDLTPAERLELAGMQQQLRDRGENPEKLEPGSRNMMFRKKQGEIKAGAWQALLASRTTLTQNLDNERRVVWHFDLCEVNHTPQGSCMVTLWFTKESPHGVAIAEERRIVNPPALIPDPNGEVDLGEERGKHREDLEGILEHHARMWWPNDG